MNVVVTRQVIGDAVHRISDIHDVWQWQEDRPISREVLLEQAVEADGLYIMLTEIVDEELLDAARRLKAISQMAVGVDNVDVEACTARGIPVGNTPDVLTETTADMAMTLLLGSVRRISEGIEFVKDGRWVQWEATKMLGDDVHGTTLGVVGLGRIGTAIARRAAGFGMHVLYTGPRRKPDAEAELGIAFRELDLLLAEADHVVLTAPLNDETHHLIDAAALDKMKDTATLVNIARGPLIDQRALTDALVNGTIARAALDVTDPEPISPDDPLLDLPNCIVVPHLGSASRRTRAAMADLAADNMLAALDDKRMVHCVNPQVYRVEV